MLSVKFTLYPYIQVGSLGAMGALDDALPLVGSMELGSPLENFGDLMSSLPKVGAVQVELS